MATTFNSLLGWINEFFRDFLDCSSESLWQIMQNKDNRDTGDDAI